MPPMIFPAGVAPPVGYDPDAPRRVPIGMLAEDIDPTTGEVMSLFEAPHPVDAAVVTILRSRYRSGPALGEIGHRLFERRNIDRTFASETDAEIQRALRPLVERGDIAITRVVVDAAGDAAVATVFYRNLRTGRDQGAFAR